ncbi:MAG: ABC transporter family substrate-binding protein [Pseudolysinimonas sp.]
MNKRILPVATVLVVAAAALSACTPTTTTVLEGSKVTVAVSTPYTSVNASTSFGRSSPTNADVAYLTGTGFGYYDDRYELVEDGSFGRAEIVDDAPFTVRYTVADGATWSDGIPVDAADLLLAWVGNSGSLNTPDFDDSDFVDADTGQYTDDFPDDVVFFDGTVGSGLELATATPVIVEDNVLDVTYDDYVPGWRLALAPGVPAHVVAERGLDLSDGSDVEADSDNDADAPDPADILDAAMAAKARLVAAVVGRDPRELAELARFWNTAYNFTETPTDPALLVSSGPYTVTEIVDNESVTLTANPEYEGDREPSYETIVLRVSPDPLETVDLLTTHQVDIATPQPTDDVVSALVDVDDVTVTAGSEGTFEHLDLQFAGSASGVFSDIRVRQAFLLVVPRQQILDDLIVPLQQDAGLLDSFVLRPGAEGYTEAIAGNGSRDYARTDVDEAEDLLAEAGVVSPRVCILYDPSNPRRIAEFSLIVKSAARAGFAVTDCSSGDWEGLLGVEGAYDAALFAWDTTRLGPAAVSAVFASDSKLANFNHYDNPEVDRLIGEVDASDDAGEVARLLTEIDAEVWSDAYGLPLFAYPTVTAVSAGVTGVTRSPLARGVFWNAWDWVPTPSTDEPSSNG